VNISVTDDQAKQRFGLFEHGCDLGGETSEKDFVNRAGSVNGLSNRRMKQQPPKYSPEILLAAAKAFAKK